jgi:transposase
VTGRLFIHVDGEQLKRLYEVEKLTTRQIADRMGVGAKTIVRRLHQFGITPRQPGPERHEQLRDKDWLATQYATKSTVQIAREIGASARVVLSWLEAHGIESKPRNQHTGREWSAEVRQKLSEAKKGKLLKEANPNWRGGLVNPNQRLRNSVLSRSWSKAVRERDGNRCAECGATGRLHAHHVKPWKDHPELRYDVDNGKTLCPPCHQRAHGWKFPDWVHTAKAARAQGVQQDDEIV